MPTNLPPEYFDADKRLRAATSDPEKVACLEEMLAIIPKHKGTDKLRADYRRKISQLKAAIQSHKKTSRHESIFHVEREGPARVVVVGTPNTGKSALLAAVTSAEPKVADYEFTTATPQPGMMPVRDIQVQLVDTPPLSRMHVEPELFNLIRSADLVLLLVDIQANSIAQLEDAVAMLEEHRIALHDGSGAVPEDPRAVPIPAVVLVTKVDDASWDDEYAVFRELFGDRWPILPVSVRTGRNVERMKETIVARLGLMRVYAKQPGKEADFGAPFVLKEGDTVAEFAAHVHKDFVHHLKTARIWGTGVHDGQMVGRDHALHDGDIVELHL